MMWRVRFAGRVFLLLCIFLAFFEVGYAGAERHKSRVLVVFNNQSGKYYNDKLDSIARTELHKKVDGIYHVLDSQPYDERFRNQSHFGDSLEKILAMTAECQADYVVYTELMPYHWTEEYDFIWDTKTMKATMGLRIIDLKNGCELFKEQYSMDKKDQTDYFFIGNPSMAKKSLQAVLFTVNEAISLHLPL